MSKKLEILKDMKLIKNMYYDAKSIDDKKFYLKEFNALTVKLEQVKKAEIKIVPELVKCIG